MAFDRSKLSLSVDTIAGGSLRIHFYVTADTADVVLGSGYFENAADLGVRVGDIIAVASETAGIGTYVSEVESIDTDGHATVISNELSLMPRITQFGAKTSSATSVAAALAAAFAIATAVVVPAGAWPIDANYSVPAGKRLVFDPGGSFVTSNAAVISLNNTARIIAGRYQIISGDGNFSNLRTAFPEWWGATDSTTVTANAAWQSALNSLRDSGKVLLDGGFYALDGTTPLAATKGQHIKGEGRYTTTIRITTAATNFCQWTTTIGGQCSDLRIANAAATPTSGILLDFETNSAGACEVSNIVVENCWDFIKFNGTSGTAINDCRLRHFRVVGIYNQGILARWSENVYISEGLLNGGSGLAPNSLIRISEKCQSMLMERVQASNSSAACLMITNAAAAISRGNDCRWSKFDQCIFDDSQTAMDLVYGETIDFTNCWFTSSGRTISGYSAGNGIRIRTARSIRFSNCVISNNGEHGIRLEATSRYVHFRDCEIAGNNYNASGAAGAWIQAGTTDWSFEGCTFANGFNWISTQVAGVLINTGSSDRYRVINCNFLALAADVTDNGTGTDKDVTTGNYTAAS